MPRLGWLSPWADPSHPDEWIAQHAQHAAPLVKRRPPLQVDALLPARGAGHVHRQQLEAQLACGAERMRQPPVGGIALLARCTDVRPKHSAALRGAGSVERRAATVREGTGEMGAADATSLGLAMPGGQKGFAAWACCVKAPLAAPAGPSPCRFLASRDTRPRRSAPFRGTAAGEGARQAGISAAQHTHVQAAARWLAALHSRARNPTVRSARSVRCEHVGTSVA